MSIATVVCRRCKLLLSRPLCKQLSSQTDNRTQHEEEVEKFDRLSGGWWQDDKDPLLLMNAVRVPLLTTLARSVATEDAPPRVLDVGCGGGYLAEELAKRGFSVTGVDPSQDMINIATQHAAKYQGPLSLEYRCATVDEIPEQYDIVVSSEVVEHVPCVETFVAQCAQRVKPGGGIMFTTINRTMKSWLFGILLAEHVAGIVPPGTHEYSKLVPPPALTGPIADCGFEIVEVTGLSFNTITWQWSKSSDLSINYAVTAIRAS